MNPLVRLLPELLLALGATTVLLVAPLRNDRSLRDFTRWFALIVVLCAGAVLYSLFGAADPFSSNGWVVSRPLNLIFGVIFLGIVAWVILAGTVPEHDAGEWYGLLLFASVGMLTLARSGNLAAFFLGLEILSLCLYVLISFSYRRRLSLRAGTMYLVLAGFASGFLVFGLALVYAAYGSLDIEVLKTTIQSSASTMNAMAMIGFGLFLVGVAFKLSLVPFHMWAPEVYEASPGVISGLIASASKGAIISAFLPFVFLLGTHWRVLWLLSVASMLGGNLLALREVRVKRILAYSSIGHIGYVLTGYLAAQAGVMTFSWPGHPGSAGGVFPTVDGATAIVFYVVAYAIAILGAFGTIALMEREHDLTLRDLRGVARRNLPLAVCLMVFVISLAGIPPTIGFWGKIYLFSAAVNAGYVWLPVLGLVASAIGIFYYIRILVHLFMMPADVSDIRIKPAAFQDRVIIASALAAVFFGLFPETIFTLLRLR